MAAILRILMFIAGPIAAFFVARDALNFSTIQTFVSLLLMVSFLVVIALWPLWRQHNDG